MKVQKKFSSLLLAGLLLVAACNNDNKPAESGTPATEDKSGAETADVKLISWDVVKEYPHDPGAFTEGLEFKDGLLYESTGEYGQSDIRKTDLATGKVITRQPMDSKFFGEGLTIMNGKVYQLTYKEGKGFIYDQKTLKPAGSFTFNTPEGWGMTNNGSQLIFDEGSNILHFIEPGTFKEVKQLKVTDEYGPVNALNELEMIKGFIYANIWQQDVIVKIDTGTGRVVARADLSTLRQRGGIPQISEQKGAPEVLNGIAYDAATNRIYITGKNWPKIFEIKLDN
jgi:glutamine cyclotransferase